MTATHPAPVLVSPGRLRTFEPSRLNALTPEFKRVLRRIQGKKQSEIVSHLEAVAQALLSEGLEGVDAHALRVSLLVLRDYVLAGYYPVVSGETCYLASVVAPEALTADQLREALRRRYEAARTRALRDRKQVAWMRNALVLLRGAIITPHLVIDALEQGPPRVALVEAREARSGLDARTLWRCVRSTWSMTPEASAPGREVALVALDQRFPGVPLGILQFRNVVPEISARDEWLGVSAEGFINNVSSSPNLIKSRSRKTLDVLERLLRNVNRDGIQVPFVESSIPQLGELVSFHRRQFNLTRSTEGAALKNRHLRVVKRAQTAQELLRGIRVLQLLSDGSTAPRDLKEEDLRDLNAGLTKLWHYHMGFVALEMSICGAAPPFGPLRMGKLMAALAASNVVRDKWGRDRPLGQIAQEVYLPDVRREVPNPGPLVVFTSGLYPGHSAQYNRVEAAGLRWKKIGETTGFGNFNVSVETAEAAKALNRSIDGYDHITKAFGEGSGARFRLVGRALSYLGLPDLRRHETKRPLYALPLVKNCREALLGWENPEPVANIEPQNIANAWWTRWVEPAPRDIFNSARASCDLEATLAGILSEAIR
ncbi:DUF4338 domain-containing protein [Micromonospora sp. MA102]|uniref:DUF4338 domain-containing protein n=1 Tax=Micromonospora sp. MA102 TaxID=2952755 RepID=UPI0021C7CE54|nr:DUF4338 domain-containing protein [Micromonospora sp. MA102]